MTSSMVQTVACKFDDMKDGEYALIQFYFFNKTIAMFVLKNES